MNKHTVLFLITLFSTPLMSMELPHPNQEMWLLLFNNLFNNYANFQAKHRLTTTCKLFNDYYQQHPECLQLTLDQFIDNLFLVRNDQPKFFNFLTKMANQCNKSALRIWFEEKHLQEYSYGSKHSPLHISFNDQCYRVVKTQSCKKLKFFADYELINANIQQLYTLIPHREIDLEWGNEPLHNIENFIKNNTTKEKIFKQICTFFDKEYNSKNLMHLFFNLFNKNCPQHEHLLECALKNSCFPAIVLLLTRTKHWKTSGNWHNNSEPQKNRLYTANDHNTRMLLAKASYPLHCSYPDMTNIISYAIENENIELVDSLLSIYYESDGIRYINKSLNKNNKSPMICALSLQSNEILKKLIDAGADFWGMNNHDLEAIFTITKIKKLIDAGYDINKKISTQSIEYSVNDPITLLHEVITKNNRENNNIELIKYLLANGAHVHPLDIIISIRNNDALDLLLKASKPDSFCFSDQLYENTNQRIKTAVNNSSEELIMKLIRHGFFNNYDVSSLPKRSLEILLADGKNIFDIKYWRIRVSELNDEAIISSLQKNEFINRTQHHQKLDAFEINQLLEQMITEKRIAVAKAAIAYGANINAKCNNYNTTLLNYAQRQSLDLIPTGIARQYRPLENHHNPIAIKGTQ